MSKKADTTKSTIIFSVDPTECPFREFRDSELSADYWGMGSTAFRAASQVTKGGTKLTSSDPIWKDEQTQPLPRSVRKYLHGWVRAEELAMNRWDSEVVVFEDNDGGRMSVSDVQLSHAQVLLRSSFCRRVLSACFMLERAADGMVVEHQWDNFNFLLGPEGWRAKYHIYSPGMKAGGGTQHRPGLSKNGCYLVRLFYLGAWRCVWVNDQVPVDATDSPLLPFSPLPLVTNTTTLKSAKQPAPMVTAPVVHLWPLLIMKAMLKLAAPEMISDEVIFGFEDESLPEFNMLHVLTGSMNLTFNIKDIEDLWGIISEEVTLFSWDDDDDTMASTMKSKSTKKPANKEFEKEKRSSIVSILIEDTRNLPCYAVPGITPGHEMSLIVTMARDVPLKRPLPEPEVPLWKNYRWVDWARRHGLYEDYDCPRIRFLKVNGLLKMSYSPHLLDVQSTESIKKLLKDVVKGPPINEPTPINKEELREWVLYDSIYELILSISVLYHPSMYQYTTAASTPSIKVMKIPNKSLDIAAPKSAPLYLQIDGPEENIVRISLSMLHPRILMNTGAPVIDYIEPAYLLLEKFELFQDSEIPLPKAYINTRGYNSMEVIFLPGRHFCRIWVHSRMNWSLSLLSQSSLLLGTRDMILSAAVIECPWVSRFLSSLGTAFNNWIRLNRSNNSSIASADREFYSTYQPDLEWDKQVVGYDKVLLHWMFRKALESLLMRRLSKLEFMIVCPVLRSHFLDPDFGFPVKPSPSKSLRKTVDADLCDCVMSEVEETEIIEEQLEIEEVEDKPLVDLLIMEKLLAPLDPPINSQVCELATEELPCGLLKDEREKVIRKHEAATVLQAHWRGRWARRCLTDHIAVTPEILKYLMDYAFGNLESLSALMNEFFLMFPGAKYAYSIASALSGVFSIQHHSGISPVTPKCKWIPYFQGVFYCHAPVKVYIDVQSSLPHSTAAIYNNDTGKQLPQVYNAHITFNVTPNIHGYTIMGHGTLHEAQGFNSDIHWQLTVLSSIDEAFHICDNGPDSCKVYPLYPCYKLHLDEIFIPNRKNILGGIHILVTKHEAVSFRVAATSPDLKMEAILRTLTLDGDLEVVERCFGIGELYWPFIRLEPLAQAQSPLKRRSMSQANLSSMNSARSLKNVKNVKPQSAGNKSRSVTRLKDGKAPQQEAKQYFIEVVATNGWPLNLAQWERVIEVRNTQINKAKVETPKKPGKEKPGAIKEKDKDACSTVNMPQPDDAYVELECSYVGNGALPKRNDERDLEFAATRRAWDLNEPGRNLRGAQIRNEFRSEFLEALPVPTSESEQSILEENFGEQGLGEHETKDESIQQHGPTPVTESGLIEMSIESEEEPRYLTMPEQLQDKFVPLYFVPLCTKEKIDESVVITSDKARAARNERRARTDAAVERMHELQVYNEHHVLRRQRDRCALMEKFFIDAQWSSNLCEAREERDEAIIRETLMRNLSSTKKKQEATKKK